MARKTKFHFNPETLSYEKVETTTWGIVKKVGLHLLTSLFSGAIFFFIFIWLVESPEEKQLSSENARMKVQYKLMERRIGDLQSILSDLQQGSSFLGTRCGFPFLGTRNPVRVLVPGNPGTRGDLSRNGRKSMSMNSSVFKNAQK